MKQFVTFLLLLTGLLSISSCKTYDKMVYFQGDSADTVQGVFNYNPIIKTDDLLNIQIAADDPESVIAFNGISVKDNASTGRNYLVNNKGEVSLPFIGNLMLAGKSRQEATLLIQSQLAEYVSNPIVSIHIANFKITVLGDVKTPGTYTIPNERITLLEAIGLSGDLKMTGNRKNILVIRDNNGKKTEYRIDLTSKQLFASPVYYLAQNDVVYVEPNRAARTESTMWRATGPMIVSLTSLVITTINLLTR